MEKSFSNSKPIYLQIVDKINHQIVRHELRAGDKLPSVREMAIQTGVNPNTIQRTYSELERIGIVETKRGQGTFVTEDTSLIRSLKTKLQTDMIDEFVQNMKELGFSEQEMIAGLEEYVDQKRGEEHD